MDRSFQLSHDFFIQILSGEFADAVPGRACISFQTEETLVYREVHILGKTLRHAPGLAQ